MSRPKKGQSGPELFDESIQGGEVSPLASDSSASTTSKPPVAFATPLETYTEYSFLDLLEDIIDNRGKTCPVVDDPTCIPLIATNCIKNESLYPVFENLRYVDDETYKTWFRGHPRPGDMIFVCKGSPGRVCWVPDPVNFCIAQDMVAIRANRNIVYPKFLFALLRTNETQLQIMNMHVGTLIPHFKKGDFGNLYLRIPNDYSIQIAIGNIYFLLSEKIALNRATNRTLEAIAQALFKSWFVDFDPVRAKARGETPVGMDDTTAALFPDSFEDSELGRIPKGWEVSTAGKYQRCFDARRIPLSSRERSSKRPGEYPYYGAASIMDYIDEWIFDGVYLLLGEDGSVLNNNGTPMTQYVWGRFWANNHAHILQGINSVTTEHLMLFYQQTYIKPYTTGAVQLKLNQANMNRIPFVFPGKDISMIFGHLLETLYSLYRSNVEEYRTLEDIRDSLLPKLLSGEISVAENADSDGLL